MKGVNGDWKGRFAMLLAASLFLCSAFTASAQEPSSDESGEPVQPNILFILADDLGLEGISAYGGELVGTPNIDRLADEGMTFTHMFVNPYCTPTRSELLTGRYPFATNTLFPIWDYDRHKNDVLDVSQPSFARQLKQAGYRTAIAGKWQLSFLSKQDWVHDFGFDTYQFWQLMDAGNQRTTRYYNPYYRRDGEVISADIEDRYGPDVMIDFLTEFMQKSNDEGQPFLAYYTALLPHWPWVPTPESVDQTAPENNLHGRGIAKFYPDMVRRLDHNVGRLLGTLDQLGIAEETVVIFLTDNGTDQHLYSKIRGQTLYGGKGTLTDRGSRVPLLMRWPGRIEPGSENAALVEAADFLPTLCKIAGAPLPEAPIHGKSFAEGLSGEDPAGGKEWVHIQKENGRYLRTKEYIVTITGIIKRVQPYPDDAAEVDPESLGATARETIDRLERALNELTTDGARE